MGRKTGRLIQSDWQAAASSMDDPELGVGVKLEKKDKNKKEAKAPREKKEKKEKKGKELKSKDEKADGSKGIDVRSSSPQKSRNLVRVLSFSSNQKKEKDPAERAATERVMSRSKSERKVNSQMHPQIEIGTMNGPKGVQTVVHGAGTSICIKDLTSRSFVRHATDMSFRKDGDCMLETVSFFAENGWTTTQALPGGARVMSYNINIPPATKKVEPLELNAPLKQQGLLSRLTSPRKEEPRKVSPRRSSPRGKEEKEDKVAQELKEKEGEKDEKEEKEQEREKEKEREQKEKEKEKADSNGKPEEMASPRSLRTRMTRFFSRTQVDDVKKEIKSAEEAATAEKSPPVPAAHYHSSNTDMSDEERIVAYLHERGLEASKRAAADGHVKFSKEPPSPVPVPSTSTSDASRTEVSGPSPPSAVTVSPSGDRELPNSAAAAAASAATAASTSANAQAARLTPSDKRPSKRISAKMVPLIDLPDLLEKSGVAPNPEQVFRPETARSQRPKQQDEPEQPAAVVFSDDDVGSPSVPTHSASLAKISPRNYSSVSEYQEMPKPRTVSPMTIDAAAAQQKTYGAPEEGAPVIPVRSPRAMQYGHSARISPRGPVSRNSPSVSPRASAAMNAAFAPTVHAQAPIPALASAPVAGAVAAPAAMFVQRSSVASPDAFELKLAEERRKEEEALAVLKKKKDEEKRVLEEEKKRKEEERRRKEEVRRADEEAKRVEEERLKKEEERVRKEKEKKEEQQRKAQETEEAKRKILSLAVSTPTASISEPPLIPPRSPRVNAYVQERGLATVAMDALTITTPITISAAVAEPSAPAAVQSTDSVTSDKQEATVTAAHPGVATAYDPQVEPSAPRITDNTTSAAASLISLSYKALKDKCLAQNLDSTGGKEDLIRRLVKAETSPPSPAPIPAKVEAKAPVTNSGKRHTMRTAEERRKQQQLEDEQRKLVEEELRKKREEAERKLREENDKLEADRRKREEERRKKKEEDDKKRNEEEAERRRKREEEEKRQNEERKKREEERKKKAEEDRKKKEDEAAKVEVERKKREDERRKQREERERQLKEEEDARRKKREDDEKRRGAAK